MTVEQYRQYIRHLLSERLVEMGVPKQAIVLAFHKPEVRQFTGFGTGEAIAH